MSKYIKRIILFSFILIIFLVTVGLVRVVIVRSYSWELPNKVHVLFMGASHITNAIDDRMMESAINMAGSSERYMFTYIKLKHLFSENKQIDTVFLQLAATDLWSNADVKYHVINEQSNFVKVYWPFFKGENWSIYRSEPIQVLGLVIQSLISPSDLTKAGYWDNLGKFNKVTQVIDTSQVKPDIEKDTGYGNEVNYKYLRLIIELCKEYNVKLIFLETPTYHPEYSYDQNYFYNAYKKYFSDVEFDDWSKWPIDMDERADAHHLNEKGAGHFTKEIMKKYSIK